MTQDSLFLMNIFLQAFMFMFFNEKYSGINDLPNQKFERNNNTRLEYEQRLSEVEKEYETGLKNVNLNEKELSEVRRKLEGAVFYKVLFRRSHRGQNG